MSISNPIYRNKLSLRLNEFEIVLNKIKDYTDYIYLHVKGEPLVHKDIIEFINKANEYNLKVNLTTNGVLFNKYAKELGKCKNLNKINFSLHSENNKPNYLEEIFDNIKYLSTNTTVIYRLWTLKNNDLDEKSTKIVDKIKEYYNLSPETVDKIKNTNNIKISSRIFVDKDNEFIWPTVNNHKSDGFCYGLSTHIAILVDGTVVPCCLDSNGVIELGNIFTDSLEDIINSNRYQNLLKSLRDRKPCEELCRSCVFKERF